MGDHRMSEPIPEELFDWAKKFRRRVRNKFRLLSLSFDDSTLESKALRYVYDDWKEKWDGIRDIGPLLWKRAWNNFLNELKEESPSYRGTDGSEIKRPDSTDERIDTYPPTEAAPTLEEIAEAEARNAHKMELYRRLTEVLKSVGKRECDVRVNRQLLLNWGMGKRQVRGDDTQMCVLERLVADLGTDIPRLTSESDGKWFSVLLRRHDLLKYGCFKLEDSWIEKLAGRNEEE